MHDCPYFAEFRPSGRLAPYVDRYWLIRGRDLATVTSRVLPDGCIDIIFNLGDPLAA